MKNNIDENQYGAAEFYTAFIKRLRNQPISQTESEALSQHSFNQDEFTQYVENSTVVRETFYNRSIVVNLHTDGRAGHVSGNLPVYNPEKNAIEIINCLGLDPVAFSLKPLYRTEGAFYNEEHSKEPAKLLQATVALTEEQYQRLAHLTHNAMATPPNYQLWGITDYNCIHWLNDTLKKAGVVDGLQNKWNYQKFKELDSRPIKVVAQNFFDDYHIENAKIMAATTPSMADRSKKIKQKLAGKREQNRKNQIGNDINLLFQQPALNMKKSFISPGTMEGNSGIQGSDTANKNSQSGIHVGAAAHLDFNDFYSRLKSSGCSQADINEIVNFISTDLNKCMAHAATLPEEQAAVIMDCMNGLVQEQQDASKKLNKDVKKINESGLKSELFQMISKHAPQLFEDLKHLVLLGIAKEEDKLRIKAHVSAYNRQIEEFHFNHDIIVGMCQNLPKLEDFTSQLFGQARLSLERRRDFQEQLSKRISAEVANYKVHAQNASTLERNYDGLMKSLKDISEKFKTLNKSHFTDAIFNIGNMYAQQAAATTKHPVLIAVAGGLQLLNGFNSLHKHKYQHMLQELQQTVSGATQHTLSSLQQEVGAKNAALANLLNVYLSAEQSRFMNHPERMLKIINQVINALIEEEGTNDQLIQNSKNKIDQDFKKRNALFMNTKIKQEHFIEQLNCIHAEIHNESIRLENLEKNKRDLKENRSHITREFLITITLLPQINVVYDFMSSLLPSERRYEDDLYDTKMESCATPSVRLRPKTDDLRILTEDVFKESCLAQKNKEQWKKNFIEMYIKSMAVQGILITQEEAGKVFDEKAQRAASESLTGWINHAVSVYEDQYRLQDQMIMTALSSASRLYLGIVNSKVLINAGFRKEAIKAVSRSFTFAQTVYQMHTLARRIDNIGFNLLFAVNQRNSDTGINAVIYGVGTHIFSLGINGLDLISMGIELVNLFNGFEQVSPETQKMLNEINLIAYKLASGQQAIKADLERVGVKVDRIEYLAERILTQTEYLIALHQYQQVQTTKKLDLLLLSKSIDKTNQSLERIHQIHNQLFNSAIRDRSTSVINAILVSLASMAEMTSNGEHTASHFPQQAISGVNRPFVSSYRFDTIGHTQYNSDQSLHHEPANVRLLKTIAFVTIKCMKQCEEFAIPYDESKMVNVLRILQCKSFNTLSYLNSLANDTMQNKSYREITKSLEEIRLRWKNNEKVVVDNLHGKFQEHCGKTQYKDKVINPEESGYFINQLSEKLIDSYQKNTGTSLDLSIFMTENHKTSLDIDKGVVVEAVAAQRENCLPLILPAMLYENLSAQYPDLKKLLDMEKNGLLKLKFEYEFSQADKAAPYDFKLHIRYLTFDERNGHAWGQYPHPISVFQTHNKFPDEDIEIPAIVKSYAVSNKANKQKLVFERLCHLIYGYYGTYNLTDARSFISTKNGTVTSVRGHEVQKMFYFISSVPRGLVQGTSSTYYSSQTNQSNYHAGLNCTQEVTGIYGYLANPLTSNQMLFVRSFQPDYLYHSGDEHNATIPGGHYSIGDKIIHSKNINMRELEVNKEGRMQDVLRLEYSLVHKKKKQISALIESDEALIDFIDGYAKHYEQIIHILRLFTASEYRYVQYVEFLANELGYHHWLHIKRLIISGEALGQIELGFKSKFNMDRFMLLIPKYFKVSDEIEFMHQMLLCHSMDSFLDSAVSEFQTEIKDKMFCSMTDNDLKQLEMQYSDVLTAYQNQRRPRVLQSNRISWLVNQWMPLESVFNDRPRSIVAPPKDSGVMVFSRFKRAVNNKDLDTLGILIKEHGFNLEQGIEQLRLDSAPNQDRSEFIKKHADIFLQIAVSQEDQPVLDLLLKTKPAFNFGGDNQALRLAATNKAILKQLLEYLIKYVDTMSDKNAEEQQSILMQTVLKYSDVIRVILTDLQFDLIKNRLELTQVSALVCSAQQGYFSTLSVLKNNDNLKQLDGQGHSVFYHAVLRGQAQTVSWLLNNGFDPEETYDGKSILLIAGLNKHETVFRVLVDAIKAKKASKLFSENDDTFFASRTKVNESGEGANKDSGLGTQQRNNPL